MLGLSCEEKKTPAGGTAWTPGVIPKKQNQVIWGKGGREGFEASHCNMCSKERPTKIQLPVALNSSSLAPPPVSPLQAPLVRIVSGS